MPASSHRSGFDKPPACALIERDLLFNTLGSCEIDPDGQASRGKMFVPRHSFVRYCLAIASAQWSVRWYLVAAWRLVMSSVCA